MLRPLARLILRQVLRSVLEDKLKKALENLDSRAFRTHKAAVELEQEGLPRMQAWLSALMAPVPGGEVLPATSTDVEEEEDESKPFLAGVQATTKGLVKAASDDDFALAIGGPQLLPDQGGPRHGPYGSGSAGRIAERIDIKARQAADTADAATDALDNAGKHAADTIVQIQSDLSEMQVAAKAELRSERYTSGWRSDAFDL